jgi:FtsZ-binding cell division protein ZapB
VAVPDANTFVVDWTGEAATDKVFVFGKKVSDFHTVDYDRIFTLNVSATQELARRVEQLEAENAALRQRNDGLQQQNEGLRSDVNNILQRLQGLEKKTLGYSNIEK